MRSCLLCGAGGGSAGFRIGYEHNLDSAGNSLQVRLSTDFYEQLRDRPVPLDMNVLKSLRSPFQMDIYAWLSLRSLRTLRLNRPEPVPWEVLREMFGSDYAEIHQFRFAFLQALHNLGWSQGYLGSILRRRIALKVWHVFALARELGIEPLSLFLTVSPPKDSQWILDQLGIAPPKPAPDPAPAAKEEKPPIDWDALEEMVQKLLCEELAKFGLLEPEQTEAAPS